MPKGSWSLVTTFLNIEIISALILSFELIDLEPMNVCRRKNPASTPPLLKRLFCAAEPYSTV